MAKGLIVFQTRSHPVCSPCSLHLAKETTFPTLKTVAPSGGTSPWKNSAPWWHLLNWKRTVLPQMNSFWPRYMNTLVYRVHVCSTQSWKFANCELHSWNSNNDQQPQDCAKFSCHLEIVQEHSMTHWIKNLLSHAIICKVCVHYML